ncbi:MAG: outer membrane protein assembly factor BamC [Gammaproteobacteria bacterium]
MSRAMPGERRQSPRTDASARCGECSATATPAGAGTHRTSPVLLTALLAALLAATGCSKLVPKLDEVFPDNRKEYQKAQSLPDLEVPPDLSTEAIRDRMAIPEGGEAARYSTYQERQAERERADQLERAQTSAIRVLENEHVLAVEGAVVQVWPKLQDFWAGEGYALELDDVELGIIETGWNEDDAQLGRNKFKIFAESGEEAGTTLLYVSREDQELVPQGEELVWQRKPRDAQAERVMVERLEASLGGVSDTRRAAAPAAAAGGAAAFDSEPGDEAATSAVAADAAAGPRHAEIVSVGGGKVYLTVAEDFASAWKSTERALEDIGVTVKDTDKGRGVYVIELAANGDGGDEDEGMFSKLKFWGDDDAEEYQVSLTGVGDKTEVVVLDRKGRWETGDQAGQLLTRLSQAFNRARR